MDKISREPVEDGRKRMSYLMNQYRALAKGFLAEYTSRLRKKQNLTQDEMAEHLRITSRAYGDLERGKYCFSAVALLFLLLMLSDEEAAGFLKEFRKRVDELEHKEAA